MQKHARYPVIAEALYDKAACGAVGNRYLQIPEHYAGLYPRVSLKNSGYQKYPANTPWLPLGGRGHLYGVIFPLRFRGRVPQ